MLDRAESSIAEGRNDHEHSSSMLTEISLQSPKRCEASIGGSLRDQMSSVMERVSKLLALPSTKLDSLAISEIEEALTLLPRSHCRPSLNVALTELRRRLNEGDKTSTFSFRTSGTVEGPSQEKKDRVPYFERPSETQTVMRSPHNASISVTSKRCETVHITEGDSAEATLYDLNSCNVFISVSASSIQMKSIRQSRLILAPVRTSVMVRDCEDITLVVAAQQIRFFDCHNVRLFVAVRGAVIIEDSDGIAVGPYHVKGFDAGFLNENWRHVKDFNWLSEEQSPNWAVLDEKEWEVFEM